MRRMMWMLVAGAMIAAGGCAADSKHPSDAAQGRWELTRLGETPMHEGMQAPTLVVEGRSVSGFAGVNRFTGSLAAEGPFLFEPLATTRMAGPPPAMELETLYLAALQQATGWEATSDTLVLSAEGIAVLSFRRVTDGD